MRVSHSRLTRRALAALIIASTSLCLASCGYSVRPPFNQGIKTVYVPAFRSLSFRKDINLMLSEQLMKEIPRRTPYRVVNSPEGADAVLEGIINFTDKNLIVPSPQNLPRNLNAQLSTEVWFYDNRPGAPPRPPQGTVITEIVQFYPELGETAELGYQKAIDKTVAQIISMMEDNWESTH